MPSLRNASMISMTLRKLMIIVLCATISYTEAQGQVAPEPPYVAQTFSFGWVGAPNTTMIRCGVLNVTLTAEDSAHPPLGPFDLNVYSQSREPFIVNQGASFWHLWEVDLDIGGPYLLSMNDAYGGSGGTSQAFNVVADPLGSTCGSSGMVASAIQLDVSGLRAQCGSVAFVATGGTAPYTLTVVPELLVPKTVTYSTGYFNYTLDLKAGVNAFFSVVDSLGNGAVSSYFTVAASSDATCLGVAPTLSVGAPALSTIYSGATAAATTGSSNSTQKSIIGPVIGGVVGGLLFVCLGIILGACLYKRRRREVRNAGVGGDNRQPESVGRMSIDGMSSGAQHTGQPGMMMNPHASTITPYDPSLNQVSRPGLYPVRGSSWGSPDNMKPTSGAPPMMMAAIPSHGGEQRMSMNSSGSESYAGVQQYMIGPGGVPQQQQVVYTYPGQQIPIAQYPSAYQPHQQVPQLVYYSPQGQPVRQMSGEIGEMSTRLSNVSGSATGGVASSGTNTSDEKKERQSSFPTPTPPYQPN